MADPRDSVQSAGTAAVVIKALGRLAVPAPLSKVAEAAGMPPAKAHRYLQALISEGFAEQIADSGHYGLGPELIGIGLAALGRIDVNRQSAALLAELRDRLGQTCILSVWANNGPTVVRVEQSSNTITIVTRLGAVLPMQSATGLVFAAYLDAESLSAAQHGDGTAVIAPPETLDHIRAETLFTVDGMLVPGICAAAAPVFDLNDDCIAVICALGPTGSMDPDPDGWMAREVRQYAGTISRQLGHVRRQA